MSDDYTEARVVAAQGSRIAFVTCKRCGAALVIDPADSFDVGARHAEWHDQDDERWPVP